MLPRHLNKHVNYATCCAALPNTENANSLAFPLGMAVSSDGAKLYVAGFGSSEVGVYDTAAIEGDTFVPSAADQIAVSAAAARPASSSTRPTSGSTCSPASTTRSRSSTRPPSSRLDTSRCTTPSPRASPTAAASSTTRSLSSSHGDSACASCHIFGDFDSLAWDLGESRRGGARTIPARSPIGPPLVPFSPDFHPMKGPMTTQSLRGMANHGPDALARRPHRRQRRGLPCNRIAVSSTRTPRS